MAGEKKGKGSGEVKSALELAMERFGGGGKTSPPLTSEQKQALQTAGQEIKARIAEVEIMTAQRVAEAEEGGDFEKAELLRKEKVREVGRLGRLLEGRKASIRRGEIKNTGADEP